MVEIKRSTRKSFLIICGLIGFVALLTGCNSILPKKQLAVDAQYVPKGADPWKFDAPAWKTAPAYPFQTAGKKYAPEVAEGGSVRFLWNEDYLWVMADMKDSDLVQENDEDAQHHYQSGDVLEMFIRPAGQKCYWEIFATPNNHRTVFSYPSPGRRLPSCLLTDGMPGYKIKLDLKGSLNNPKDRDKGWRCIAGIPMKELRKKCPLDFNSPWLIQVSRYNYSIYFEDKEFSQLGITTTEGANYHCFASYAKLYFDKGDAKK